MMLTTAEVQLAEELARRVRKVKENVEDELEYARQRKLTTVGGEWERRVEELARCVALLAEVERRVEAAYS